MANWSGWVITEKGLNLLAKVQAGRCNLEITKCRFGSGTITNPSTATALSDAKQEFEPNSYVVNNSTCSIYTNISNENLAVGYDVKEWGIFAEDPDAGEVLYAVNTDPNPDYMPGRTETSTILTVTMTAHISISNSQNITVNVNPAGLATVTEVIALIDAHDKAAAAHFGLLNILERGKAYNENDVARHGNLPSYLELMCTAAGTTDSAVEPSLTGLTEGDAVTDGTVEWTVVRAGGGSSTIGFFTTDSQGYTVLKPEADRKTDPVFIHEADTGYITIKP